MGGQHSGQGDLASGVPTPAPTLGMAPTGLVGAPAGGMSPQMTAGPDPPDPDPESDDAVASAPIAPRPYGTPVPGGVLVGADISMQIRVRNARGALVDSCAGSLFPCSVLLAAMEAPAETSSWTAGCQLSAACRSAAFAERGSCLQCKHSEHSISQLCLHVT